MQLMLKPSQGPSRSGAQAIFGTRAGATIGMGGVATTTGGEMDPTPMAIVVDFMVLAIVVDFMGQVVPAITADPLIAAVN